MKKYDCSKALDYAHEVARMCHSFSECNNGCPLESKYCEIKYITQEYIDLVQKWSDSHPEQSKLTNREYEFLSVFQFIAGMSIKRTDDGLFIVFHHALDNRADGFKMIDPNLFPFIPIGEEWYFDKLLSLEVEE